MSTPRTVALDAVTPGMDLEEVVFGPLQRVDIVRYAGASGDFNPIHTDEGYARATGAPTVFAMGMLPAGYLAHALSDWFGGPQRVRRFKVRFTTRVWPGDEIACGAPWSTYLSRRAGEVPDPTVQTYPKRRLPSSAKPTSS